MSIKKVIAPVVLLAFGNAALAMEWTDVKANSLSWPIAGTSVKNSLILFDHNDSAGLVTSVPNAPKHLGIDIAAPENTLVTAVDDGVVVKTGTYISASGGKPAQYYAIVESGTTKKWTTTYGHLKDVALIAEKTKVVKGKTVIGKLVYQDDNGDIPHLHIAIRNKPYFHAHAIKGYIDASDQQYKLDKYGFVDPLKYLAHNVYSIADDLDASKTGTWTTKKTDYYYHGSGFATTKTAKAVASFSLPLDCGGTVKVYTRWPLNKDNTKSAVVEVYLASTFITSKVIDQTKGFYDMAANVNGPASGNTYSWFYLGDVYVGNKCSQLTVKLKSNDATRTLSADAIMIEKN